VRLNTKTKAKYLLKELKKTLHEGLSIIKLYKIVVKISFVIILLPKKGIHSHAFFSTIYN